MPGAISPLDFLARAARAPSLFSPGFRLFLGAIILVISLMIESQFFPKRASQDCTLHHDTCKISKEREFTNLQRARLCISELPNQNSDRFWLYPDWSPLSSSFANQDWGWGAKHTGLGALPAESDAGGGSHHKIQTGARPLSRLVLQPEAVGAGAASPRRRSQLAPQAIGGKGVQGTPVQDPSCRIPTWEEESADQAGTRPDLRVSGLCASLPLPEVGVLP
ncbi:hypothetical protein NDU88_004101 [Pleurodeles waltl]|uniref:Uncharacterized protein n=1 Tax=Pleurodeles waltl TaxID=8319 RepID=A0AAV7LPZ1_PLEWA|nr:hypothetical protein NDU88_004101 [Pleurodeles waltl]